MTQASLTQGLEPHLPEGDHRKALLGPLLCWAVVFADIGSSIYYVPGILYASVGALAGFFVLLTMAVFVLLTLKYAEVSARFPEGGGVVSVAAQGINTWAGALGGIFILVSYFLTAAISCLSALQYLAVVFPSLLPYLLVLTVCVLLLLGVLNWFGISESARVSMIAALIAFGSNLAILWSVFSHLSFSDVLSLFFASFSQQSLTPTSILVGFSGAFLAFSGLESISQLSPVMKAPRKKVISLALLLVVLTIFFTSPLLTSLATLLQPEAARHEVLATQLVSLLGGKWGGVVLQTEVAISASLILVFASNTAIIGAYHVFMALSRMDFLPSFVLKKNRFRNTPHYSIALATGIPILILLVVNGQINLLGDMYAFGLLGAFLLTCLGLDLIRYRERRARRLRFRSSQQSVLDPRDNGYRPEEAPDALVVLAGTKPSRHIASFRRRRRTLLFWKELEFWLGILTTALVFLAWSVGLFSKPLGTAFGGSVALLGLGIAVLNYARRGYPPVIPSQLEGHVPEAVLALLSGQSEQNEWVIESALREAKYRPVLFVYLSQQKIERAPRPFEIVDPYQEDASAKAIFGKAEQLARKAGVSRRFIYRLDASEMVMHIWRFVQPRDLILAADYLQQPEIGELHPDRIRYELFPGGKVAHLIKNWY
jgi:amino acid transporter